MSRETIAAGCVPNTPEALRAWVRDPNALKPGALMPAMQLDDREARRARRVPPDPAVAASAMSSESLPFATAAVPASRDARVRLLETLHGWVTTVDHKRLGILYVLYGIVFLAVGGVEATIMRIQLAVPNNHFVVAAGLQPAC